MPSSTSTSTSESPHDEGVSEVLGMVFTLAIVLVLVTGFLLAMQPVRNDAERAAAASEAQALAHRVAHAVVEASILSQQSTGSRLFVDLPFDVAGRDYSVALQDGFVEVRVLGLSVQRAPLMGVQHSSVVCEHSVSGGPLSVVDGPPPSACPFPRAIHLEERP